MPSLRACPCPVLSLAGRLAASTTRHPWPWVGGLVATLVAFPSIDLTVSSWFWDPATHAFPARIWPPAEWVRLSMPRWLLGGTAAIAVLWLAGELAGRALLGISRRVALYLLSSLALGPGLVVNLILKEHWGRPRPSTLLQFGGEDRYVAPMALSNACGHNCSFPSGHAALAFWLVALALLAPPRLRPWAIGLACAAGGLVGLVRIAQGGHFLSDVVFSAIITISLSVWLHRIILAPAEVGSSKNNRAKGGESP